MGIKLSCDLAIFTYQELFSIWKFWILPIEIYLQASCKERCCVSWRAWAGGWISCSVYGDYQEYDIKTSASGSYISICLTMDNQGLSPLTWSRIRAEFAEVLPKRLDLWLFPARAGFWHRCIYAHPVKAPVAGFCCHLSINPDYTNARRVSLWKTVSLYTFRPLGS